MRQRQWLWTGRAVDVGGIYLKGLEERQKLNASSPREPRPLDQDRRCPSEGCFASALLDGILLHVFLVMP